jgi:F-type H+-transporting ATPase subunit b
MILTRAIIVVLICAAPAAAAEEHAASINQLWFPLINFLIFLFLLRRFAVPLVRDYFRARRQGIARSINEAAAEKERAEARLQEYKKRWAGVSADIKKIHETFVADGEGEKTRSLAEAETLARKIKSDAEFLAAQETRVAERKLRAELARQARAAAERTVRNQLTAQDAHRLIDEFVTRLGDRP